VFGVSFPGQMKPEHQGVMVYETKVTTDMVRDGLSRTMMIAECTGRGEGFQSEWVNGQNIFDHSSTKGINVSRNNEIFSDHPGGAVAVFCDGHTKFLDMSIDQTVLVAMLTRAGGETIAWEE
jgi:prepilin-type processing-associated H-X9-DG protein